MKTKWEDKLKDIFNELELSDHSEEEFSKAYVETLTLLKKAYDQGKQEGIDYPEGRELYGLG